MLLCLLLFSSEDVENKPADRGAREGPYIHLFMFIWAFSVTHVNKKVKARWKQGFIHNKVAFDIVPTSLLHRLPLSSPSISLFFLLHPQTPSYVFSLHRWVIPRQNNALLCFIELPLSSSHFPFSFLPFICRALFFPSSAHSFPFYCLPNFWEDWRLTWGKNNNGGREEKRMRMSEGCRVLYETLRGTKLTN